MRALAEPSGSAPASCSERTRSSVGRTRLRTPMCLYRRDLAAFSRLPPDNPWRLAVEPASGRR